MASVYIHIPFCKQACHYCNFHFLVSKNLRVEFIKALKNEIALQKNFFYFHSQGKTPIDTLYFGGGTPSVLGVDDIWSLIDEISSHFILLPDAEITLEANPDDLCIQKIHDLRLTPVNRLSIGIQSFQASDLIYLNRAHNPDQAIRSLEDSINAGFFNINVDMIYGIPGLSDAQWIKNLEILTNLDVNHISAYCLTVEPKTPLELFIRRGTKQPADELQAANQFELLCSYLAHYGYQHYEISNFGKPGFFSRHNLAYWLGQPYLGLGPSAHSFIPGTRKWNLPNTSLYIAGSKNSRIPFEEEILSVNQQFNEYVMTSLRTMWGIDKRTIIEKYGEAALSKLLVNARKHLSNQTLMQTRTHLILTQTGKFLCDGIAADLFLV